MINSLTNTQQTSLKGLELKSSFNLFNPADPFVSVFQFYCGTSTGPLTAGKSALKGRKIFAGEHLSPLRCVSYHENAAFCIQVN